MPSPQDVLGRAVDLFWYHDDLSLLADAAASWCAVEADDRSKSLADALPPAFRARACCAFAHVVRTEETALRVATAMWTSIVRDPAFPSIPDNVQAMVLYNAGGCWSAADDVDAVRGLRSAVAYMRRAADLALQRRLPSAGAYHQNLASLLLRTDPVESATIDEAFAALAQALEFCRSSAELRLLATTYLELARHAPDKEGTLGALEVAVAASRHEELTDAARDELRCEMGETARRRAYAARSVELCRGVEDLLADAVDGLPMLGLAAQVLRDELARVRGWRLALETSAPGRP